MNKFLFIQAVTLLLVLVNLEQTGLAQKTPAVIQRERNPFPNGQWAMSNKGQVLISSNAQGTIPHLWTSNQYVTNPALDKKTYDFLAFSQNTDLFIVAQSAPLKNFRNQLRGVSGFSDSEKNNSLSGTSKDQNRTISDAKKSGSNSKASYDVLMYQMDGKRAMKAFATLEAANEIQWLTVSGDGQKVALYNPSTQTIEVAAIREGFNTSQKRFKDILYPTPLYDLQLTAKGGQLLVAQNSRVSLFDMQNGEMLQSMKIDPDLKNVHFANGGRLLVAKDASAENAVIIDLRSGRDLVFDIDPADQVTVTPDGQWLVQLTTSELKFVKLANRTEVYTELLHEDCNRNCQMTFASSAGRMMIWADEPQRLYVVTYPFATK
ncbi:MAG: hypothetical protein KF851_11620 [Pirellulaceae bacterium]|nr:hypothetical protein [Pirellulaceae bacterium]